MLNKKESLAEIMQIDTEERVSRLSYINLTDADCELLRQFKPVIEKNADMIVNKFYENLSRYPELNNIIEFAGSTIERLKITQKRYLLEIFDGKFDAAYFENQLKIGVIHKKIGLTPRWYLGGYSIYLQLINPLIMRKYWYSQSKALALQAAFNKVISIDAQLAIDTYTYALLEDVKHVSLSKQEIEDKIALYKAFIAKVSEGDLTQQLPITGDDDLASLGVQINSMVSSLSQMTRHITGVGQNLSENIARLNSTILSQSSGASQQASAVNETTTTLEEIKATSQQTQTKAQTLGQVAENIRMEGEHGIIAVQQVIKSMGEIREQVNTISQTILMLSEKTQQIGNITTVIANLTQQSKMLALNASIEAAKAGDAGKGFAVVAAEVRDLAEQSQQSTEQVHKILRDIQLATDRAVMATEQGTKGVDQGEELVKNTGSIMEKLNRVINESVTASQQIVAAVRQEGAGISQVAIAMNEINKVTAQFVGAAEQSKTVSSDLAEISKQLQQNISVYKNV
jgi:methyl-accepting chemotaxis protein